MIKKLAVLSAAAALAALSLQAAHAGGFYAYQVNPAATILPKTAWLNPANMTAIDTMSVQATVAVVSRTLEFDPDVAGAGGKDGSNAANGGALPDVSFVMPLSEKWRFGVALTGLLSQNNDFGDDFVGRYSVDKFKLGAVGLTPSFGYKVNDQFSVGAGAALVRTTLDEDIAINNDPFSPGAPDGEATFDELDDTGVQPFVGIAYRINENLLFGLVYRGQMDVELEGDLDIDDFNGVSAKADAEVDWTNPQTLEFGVQFRINERSYFLFNADWEDWSEFSDNVLALDTPGSPQATLDRNWDDTWHGEASYVRLFGKNAMIVGVSHDTSAVEDEDRTFDLPVDSVSRVTGGYWWLGNPTRKWGITGQLSVYGDAPIDQTSQGVQVTGEFDKNSAFLIAGSLLWSKGQ